MTTDPEFSPASEGNTAAALGEALRCLPCEWCRGAEADAAQLLGLRLGRHERRVLLAASGPGEQARQPPETPAVVRPEGSGRAAAEALRRAIRTLVGRGLLETGRNRERWRVRRGVRLTPLGSAVVDVLRADLAGGRPIRWERHLADLIARARRDPAWLLERFDWALEGAMFFGGVFMMAAACRDDGDRAGRLQQLQARLGAVRRAIAGQPSPPACPRCSEARDLLRPEPGSVALCARCWAGLGRAWSEEQPAIAGRDGEPRTP